MMRRSLIDRIGAFDEDYYFYCEDVDLCWRVNHAPLPPDQNPNDPSPDAERPNGTWRVTYYPESIIYHLIGKSSDKVPTRMTYEFHRSQYLFFKKHYAASMPPVLRPLIPVGIGLRAVGQMVRFRVRYLQRRLRGEEPDRRRKRPEGGGGERS